MHRPRGSLFITLSLLFLFAGVDEGSDLPENATPSWWSEVAARDRRVGVRDPPAARRLARAQPCTGLPHLISPRPESGSSRARMGLPPGSGASLSPVGDGRGRSRRSRRVSFASTAPGSKTTAEVSSSGTSTTAAGWSRVSTSPHHLQVTGAPCTSTSPSAGSFRPVVAADGRAIDFRDVDGNVLRYAKLYVEDASGAELPSRMEGFVDGPLRGVRLIYDDTGATYPVVVDPTLSDANWSSSGDGGGDEYGHAVATAGGRQRRRLLRRDRRRLAIRQRPLERGAGAGVSRIRLGALPHGGLVGRGPPELGLLRRGGGHRGRRQRRRLLRRDRRSLRLPERPERRGPGLRLPRLGIGPFGDGGLDRREQPVQRPLRQLGLHRGRRQWGRLPPT